MEFRIADTFTDSLGRLTGGEQKAVKTTAFDLQLNPASPGMQFHKLDRARDKNFWSVRVNADIRLIVHKTADSLLLCYVDHHDKAYNWAEGRKLQTHPKTGAAQLVELRETVQEIVIPAYVEAKTARTTVPQKPLFDRFRTTSYWVMVSLPSGLPTCARRRTIRCWPSSTICPARQPNPFCSSPRVESRTCRGRRSPRPAHLSTPMPSVGFE